VKDLRVVILDESHDGSYKQEEEPRYDARWVARWLVRKHRAVLIEGTATPSLESLRPGVRPLEMRTRPTGAQLPEVEVVDMRRQGSSGVLAPRSIAALRDVLVAGRQAVVLLNRRGYAGYLMCEECGEVVMCDDCEVSMTFHRGARALVCHHCGRRSGVPAVCPSCSAAALRRGTPGTERVVDELESMVPPEHLFRLDSDVVTSGARVSEILRRFKESAPGVLVGTQMVAKGHDYPLVTLVLVADADTGLYVPDFRASERTFQLLTQVAGRAGRAADPGRVIVQTWNPEVPCIRMAVAREDHRFYEEELAARERHAYPPFRELIRIVLSGAREDKVEAGGRHLAGKVSMFLEDVRGPARLPRLRALSRRQLVVTDPDPERARVVVERSLERYRAPYARRGLDILVDVDPQWFN
jgi:primosomal protein N' (replication factor Y)